MLCITPLLLPATCSLWVPCSSSQWSPSPFPLHVQVLNIFPHLAEIPSSSGVLRDTPAALTCPLTNPDSSMAGISDVHFSPRFSHAWSFAKCSFITLAEMISSLHVFKSQTGKDLPVDRHGFLFVCFPLLSHLLVVYELG